jgi:hypothetical protein
MDTQGERGLLRELKESMESLKAQIGATKKQ